MTKKQHEAKVREVQGGTRSSDDAQIYRPLGTDNMRTRIVRLLPGRKDEVLEATLLNVTIPPKDQTGFNIFQLLQVWLLTWMNSILGRTYEAISYTWGNIDKKVPIVLNGAVMDVPASAANVLSEFRSTTTPLNFWLDAISINQGDLAERSSQVQFMGSIYSNAVRTRIWLGPEDVDTSTALEACKSIAAQLESLRSNEDGPEAEWVSLRKKAQSVNLPADFDLATLDALFQRRWFTRIWVFQEAALSRNCVCYIGAQTITWDSLSLAALWYSEIRATQQRVDSLEEAWPWFASLASRRKANDLEELIDFTKRMTATDPRDHFYGLLGLTRSTPSTSVQSMRLRPDYTAPFRVCACKAVKYAMQESGQLHLLVIGNLFTVPDSVNLGVEPWPSWIRCMPMAAKYDVSIGLPRSIARAHDGRGLDRPLMEASLEPSVLLVRGYEADVVRTIIPSDASPAFDSLGNLRKWFASCSSALGELFESPDELLGFLLNVDTRSGNITAEDGAMLHFAALLQPDQHSQRDGDPSRTNSLSEGILHLWTELRRVCDHRTLFVTQDGRPGIGPTHMSADSRVVIFFGGKLPFVVGDEGYGDVVIGPCYVRGIMHGEVVRKRVADGIAPRIFELH